MMRKAYLQHLSRQQKLYYVATFAVALMIVGLGMMLEPEQDARDEHGFTVDMSIAQIALPLDVTGKALARELGLPLNVAKNKPLSEAGVTEEQLEHAVAHLLSHRPTMLKYYVFVALVLFGFVFLTRLARPDRADPSDRHSRYPMWPYWLTLVIAVVVCGFMLGKSPNPMEGAVKVFKAMAGLYPSVVAKLIALAFFLLLVLVGNKLICGWACPLGALQELIYSLPVLRKIKRRKLPFWLGNTIRIVLFVMMLLLMFGIVGNKKGFVLYHNLNAFNLFDFKFETPFILITAIATLVISLFLYRPFCHLICPFGLVSWLIERFSLVRVRVDRQTCNSCGACSKACPSEAARHLIEGKVLGADCFSCSRCLNVCPHDSLRYGLSRPTNYQKQKSNGSPLGTPSHVQP